MTSCVVDLDHLVVNCVPLVENRHIRRYLTVLARYFRNSDRNWAGICIRESSPLNPTLTFTTTTGKKSKQGKTSVVTTTVKVLVSEICINTQKNEKKMAARIGELGPSQVTMEPSLAVKFLGAGTAACMADCITFPLDTAKVRLQLQGETGKVKHIHGQMTTSKPKYKYRGLAGTVSVIMKEEGVAGLYKGIVPGLQRQMCFSCIRIGCYDDLKNKWHTFFYGQNKQQQQTTLGVRILSGLSSGALAVTCAQPTDVVKIRMQGSTSSSPNYRGSFHAYKMIGTQEGLRGLWRGYCPNVTRNAIINVGEVVTYDLIKETLVSSKLMADNIFCHFVSAFGAGFCATVVASPVDVVKTRYMNATQVKYSGVWDCASQVVKEGGARAFYKGFIPSFMRIGSWNVVMFITYEQLKKAFADKPTVMYN
ncbi:hypothetical protein ScPMuIL_012521 [Solemya velum]